MPNQSHAGTWPTMEAFVVDAAATLVFMPTTRRHVLHGVSRRTKRRMKPVAPRSSVDPRIEDGHIVGIDAPPGPEMIEQTQRRRTRLQQQPVDVVILQQSEK